MGTNAPFNAAMFELGRPARRFASGDNGATSSGSATGSSTIGAAISSSGGTITTTRSSAGVYRMTVQGLARGAGGSETVLLTTRNLVGASRCVIVSWQSVAADLEVDVRCYDHTGGLSDTAFHLVVIE